jgi:HrpA-like RNA helicase
MVYTNEVWNALEDYSVPAVYTSDLTNWILFLKTITNDESIFDFDWLDRPATESVALAMHTLFHLGAINLEGKVTKIGKFMNNSILNRVPIQMRRALYTSFKLGVSWEVAAIIVLMNKMEDIWLSPHICSNGIYSNFRSDHITMLHIYQEFLKLVGILSDNELRKHCFMNCLDYNELLNVPKDIFEILAVFMGEKKIRIPNFSMNTPFEKKKDYTDVADFIREPLPFNQPDDYLEDDVYQKVAQALFSGHFMQTAEFIEGSKEYYRCSVGVTAKIDTDRSLVFNSRKSNLGFPKHLMYTNLIMTTSLNTGIAQYKMSMISEYNPNWWGEFAPDYKNLID